VPTSGVSKAEIEVVRQRVSKMSDCELLRFGMMAKCKHAQLAKQGQGRVDVLSIELGEARAEWNRRYANLPLCDSF
jgi:hypothetical protein